MKPTQPKKILYVIGSLDRGGAEGQLIKLALNIESQHWSPRVFCLSRLGVQANLLIQRGIPVEAPRELGAWPLFKSRLIGVRIIRAIWSMMALAKSVFKFRPDIIHFILPEAYIAGGLLTIIVPVPIRVMSRRSLNRYQQKFPLVKRIECWLHQRMGACIGNSKAVTSELLEEGASASKVKLIYNGLDSETFQPNLALRESKLAELGIVEPVIICTVVANLIAYKGHLDLVDAVAKCRSRLDHRLVILLIGRNDGMQDEIQARIDHLGLSDTFIFLGSRGDTPDWLCASDFLVLASHEEGFSNVILEAMACALPVVATDVGGNSEAIMDSITGLLVPKCDPKRLGIAIETLVNDSSLRSNYGRRGRERVCEYFSLQHCVREYEDMYKNLLNHVVKN